MALSLFGGKSKNTYIAPNVDFLRTPAGNVDFSQGFRTYRDFLDPTQNVADARFNQYASAIAAPTSTAQVRGELQREQLQSTIGDIERDTRGRFGQGIYDYFGRGLFDPTAGADSTVARAGLGQIAAEGARTAANARTTLGLGDIERQAAREEALRQAYGQRYQFGEQADTGLRNLAGTDAQRYSQLYADTNAANIDRELNRRYQLANVLNEQARGRSAGYQPGGGGVFGQFLNLYASGLGSGAASGGGLSKYAGYLF